MVAKQSAMTFLQTDLQGRIGLDLNSGAQIGKWYEQRKKPASLEQFMATIARNRSIFCRAWCCESCSSAFGNIVMLYGKCFSQSGILMGSHVGPAIVLATQPRKNTTKVVKRYMLIDKTKNNCYVACPSYWPRSHKLKLNESTCSLNKGLGLYCPSARHSLYRGNVKYCLLLSRFRKAAEMSADGLFKTD